MLASSAPTKVWLSVITSRSATSTAVSQRAGGLGVSPIVTGASRRQASAHGTSATAKVKLR